MPTFRIPAKQPALEMAAGEREYFERAGYWLCLGCKGPCAEVENQGEYNQCCQKCRSVVQWIPPKEQRAEPGARTSEILEADLSGMPTKQSLAEACFKGFHTCMSCGHIVQVSAGKCAQCGSEKVIWNKPVLGAEIVEAKSGKPATEVKAAA